MMDVYDINQTVEKLKGPTREQIIVHNQWAAVAFDKFHQDSNAVIEFTIDGATKMAILKWNSGFSRAAMKEKTDIAHYGGVAMAKFVMAVLLDYGYLEQTEIGDGVDYRFMKTETGDDELNFLANFHYVEVSGILEESPSNTLKGRIKDKHGQIDNGTKRDESCSVIVTLFSKPQIVKEVHK